MRERSTPRREKHSSLQVYRQILQYIHGKDLEPGDRMPTHAELVGELRTCHATLDTAMKWLTQDGVLNRKPRLGTTLSHRYPLKPGRPIWQVGIVVPSLTSSYFVPMMTHCLHKYLGRRGIADRVYMIGADAPPGDEVTTRRVSDFPGLAEDLDAGVLHAVLNSTRLVMDDVPVCGVGSIRGDFYVSIDDYSFATDAVERLLARGCRRILAAVAAPDDGYAHRYEEGLEAAKRERGLDDAALQFLRCSTGIEQGYRVARHILQSPRGRRPDAVILKDDITAQACSSLLAREGVTDLPVAVRTNLQIPLSFALPTLIYAVDLDEVARLSVDLLVQKLLRPGMQPESLMVSTSYQEEAHHLGAMVQEV